MVERVLAGIGLVCCVVLLLGMVLGRDRVSALKGRVLRLLSWRRRRREAQDEALQAIARARQPVQRDGNVLRPERFKRPPQDRLH